MAAGKGPGEVDAGAAGEWPLAAFPLGRPICGHVLLPRATERFGMDAASRSLAGLARSCVHHGRLVVCTHAGGSCLGVQFVYRLLSPCGLPSTLPLWSTVYSRLAVCCLLSPCGLQPTLALHRLLSPCGLLALWSEASPRVLKPCRRVVPYLLYPSACTSDGPALSSALSSALSPPILCPVFSRPCPVLCPVFSSFALSSPIICPVSVGPVLSSARPCPLPCHLIAIDPCGTWLSHHHRRLLTVYSSPCTPHRVLLTVYPSPCTPHRVRLTVYSSPCTLHPKSPRPLARHFVVGMHAPS